ncbi:energy transducer TonB [Methylovulum miyakonense]|uniref:energy transducer TonB n=1 Tax=Methylovulum miyakonense TaxID=645578 RepID=UPI000A07A5E1|nr:energy transducer TonB [Methylovulum miyakonense]
MLPVTLAAAHPNHRWPVRATVVACLISIALHSGIWHAWQGMSAPPLPEAKPPVVIEVALTSAPSPQPPAATPAQPSQTPPVAAKPPAKAAEKAKPIAKPKPKPVAKPPEPKKARPTTEPKPKETPVTETAPAFNPPPVFTPAPAQASPKPAPAAAPPALVKAAYSAPGLKNPPTRYPKIAQMRQWEGTVTLEVRVLASGSAGEVKIVSSSGHEILDESAVEQVKSWRFIPAHKGDKSVDDWVRVPISFKFKR